MKTIALQLLLLIATANACIAQQYDILDKTMTAWNQNGGLPQNQAWSSSQKGNGITIQQQNGYVTISKSTTAASNNYAFLVPPALDLEPNQAYSIEIEARMQEIAGLTTEEADTEANQLSARINGRNMAVFLKYGDSTQGYIALSANAPETERYYFNTGDWHKYRFVFHANQNQYDIYLDQDQDPIFESATTTSMTGSSILRIGAESSHRCHIDLAKARMATGDFWSQTKIIDLSLSAENQLGSHGVNLTATAHTAKIENGSQLQAVILNPENQQLTAPIAATVTENSAEFQLSIPQGAPQGQYQVIVSAPGGYIGETPIAPRTANYNIYTDRFVGKRLLTFGNSITIAENSWAVQTAQTLGFSAHYNGAMSASVWCKREKTFDNGLLLKTQNYTDKDFAGITTQHYDDMTPEEWQKRLNNCAIVHLQKYLSERQQEQPDCVIFSYGTNDPLELAGNPATDAENPYTLAGAMKYCIDTLQTLFPHAEIYISLPLQASAARNKNNATLQKITVMNAVCAQLHIPVFDCYHESGITEENQAKYLSDGLHPNEMGKKLHSQYIIKKLNEIQPATANKNPDPENQKTIALLSAKTAAGSQISIKTIKNDILLAQAEIFDLTGRRIYQKSQIQTQYTLLLPATAGIYLLSVTLSDNTRKTFKIRN